MDKPLYKNLIRQNTEVTGIKYITHTIRDIPVELQSTDHVFIFILAKSQHPDMLLLIGYMSELPSHNPDHDRRRELNRAQRFDVSFSDALADALEATGDNKNAESQREQAQRQRQIEEARQRAEKYEKHPELLYRDARRFNTADIEALTKALEAKRNQSLYRQVEPPRTK